MQKKIFESLEQKYFYETITCSILKNGVNYRIKNIADDLERFIPFEEIGKVVKRKQSKNILYILFAMFAGGLIIASLIEAEGLSLNDGSIVGFAVTSIVMVILLAAYVKDSVATKSLKCEGSEIRFFYNKTNRAKVDKFIPILIETRNNYFKSKYLKKDSSISYGMYLERLRWLMEDGIIDIHEYEVLKELHIKENEMQQDDNYDEDIYDDEIYNEN